MTVLLLGVAAGAARLIPARRALDENFLLPLLNTLRIRAKVEEDLGSVNGTSVNGQEIRR